MNKELTASRIVGDQKSTVEDRLTAGLSLRRRLFNHLLTGAVCLCTALTVALLLFLIIYVFSRGLPHITWELLSTAPSALRGTIGILPNLLNTLYIILISLVIVLPIGIGAAIFLNEYASNQKLVSVIEFASETLAGIPSIIYGLVGMLFFCQLMGLQTSILAGSLTLVVMILPTIMRTTQEALKTVPQSYREGAVGIGATKWYMIRTIILPSCLDGIVSGAILAVGRIVGESASLMFTAGIGAVVVKNIFTAMSRSGGTLSVALYVYVFERGEFDVGFAIAAILMTISLTINISTKVVQKRLKKI